MCLAGQTITEHLDAMLREAVSMELERVRPEQPCSMCIPGQPCCWHVVMFQQGEGK